ncbi:MAG TPA: MBL fold metallo-hydrolase, partial [Candidatus Limnocylindrales bacterium]|nr:MBL fold metallo-hydrolase [Candidatus Limnocylindrales bacterium]
FRSVRARRLVLLLLALVLSGCAGVDTEPLPGKPSHHVAGGFRNPSPEFRRPDGWTRFTFFVRRGWQALAAARSYDAPRVDNDGRALREAGGGPSVTWVGPATLLVQVDGVNMLTDPHWGPRASPMSWAGPRRLSAPGLAFESLPPIHLVLISHDHYDHLDLGTVTRLARTHDPLFVVPLGLKRWFADQGITRVEELDWWQSTEHGGLRLICAPAQHFSQRTLWDGNTRLWASWMVLAPSRRFYFGGDSGYFSGFKEAGDRYGPFDLAAIAIGAYVPASIMRLTHTTPEEAFQASLDLRARVMLAIHWGTFDLADEPLDEPPKRLRTEVDRRGLPPERAWVFRLGETRRW